MICPYQNLAKPTMKYCEDNLCTYIAAPANTWSNLAYILVGIYLIFISSKNKNFLLKLLGPIAIITGLTSGIYHATFSHFWQLFDNGSMFFFISLLLIMNLNRLKMKNSSSLKLVSIYILINIISLLILYYKKVVLGINVGIIIFAFQSLIVLITEYFCFIRSNRKYIFNNLIYAIAILLIAWGIWWLDFLKIWCNPATSHYINGHAVWHILTSISFIFVYRFYEQFDKKATS